MAPCMTMHNTGARAGNEMRKLRKPVIEKMRRDRINSSIDQLRILLHKEFPQQQHLPSRAEKAEILEMAVTFLQHHLAEKNVMSCTQAHTEDIYLSGYDHSHQLIKHSQQTASQELSHVTPAPEQTTKSLWRPW
ncbi:transcription factor HES-5-like [Pelodytes ibericus]